MLRPLSVETFLDEIWGATRYHVKRRQPDYFDRLLPGPSAAETLLEHVRPEPSAVRLVRGGADKDPGTYRLADGTLDLERVRGGLADGYTIVLNGLERYVRGIASLSHSIEVELNYPTRVNAYVTPPGSRGFVPHYDPHDVLVLQIHGSKTWRLSNDAAVPPHEMERRKGVGSDWVAPPTEVTLEAGDTLYVPRGQVHSAETDAGSSVHLTVGMHAPTVLTLLTHLLHALSLRDDRVHARLSPRHLDDAGARAGLAGLVRDTLRDLEDPSVIAAGLDAMAEVLVRRGRCPPVGQLSETDGIDGRTLVAKHQPLYSRVTQVADGVALQFAQLSMRASADHEEALRFLSGSTGRFRVGDLPGLTAAQQAALARTLILNGFLVRLSDD
ncbi:cupin domain-containing protein [Mycobacterium sp. SMC-2]|uniref:cupin domain-containing protein n=1 Tax=Mycobacterium sp. SMC-2 TaxID=2857058 RepID=UPI0021B31CF4|nr:cupin domain-containing protein [Mycobacterium sp. SMC-2]